MSYNFYGWETANIKPVDDVYKDIKDPRDLYDRLCNIWCEYSCAPRLRGEWSRSNITLGQCSVTAFLAQDIFGGEVYGVRRPGGNYHCYNVVGDVVFDLTSEQFGDERLSYSDNPRQSREEHFSKEEKRFRYIFLKEQLLAHLEGSVSQVDEHRLERTERLLGAAGVERLKNSHIALFGLGGVGGYVCEALVRSGIGQIDLIDHDLVTPSNINRQIIATEKTIGRRKTDLMCERIHDIAPAVRVKTFFKFVLPENISDFRMSDYDYVIDAIDTVSAKLAIIEAAKREGVNIISSMGTGNKLHPELLKISDIYKTRVCPLARVMRRELKKRGVDSLKVLYSEEEPINPSDEVIGSVSFVPPAAGLMLAAEVVRDLTGCM